MYRNFSSNFRSGASFWRKNQKLKIKRNRAKNVFKKLIFSMAFIFIGASSYFCFTEILKFLKNWDFLMVKEVKIHASNPHVEREVREKIKRLSPQNLLFTDAEVIENLIRENPYIKEVNIRKILPTTLEIFLVEREGIAILSDKNFFLIDEDGEIIKETDKSELLPIIEGATLKDSIAIKIGIDLIKDLKKKGFEKFVETIEVSNPFNIGIRLRGSPTKVYLGSSDFLEKLERFMKLEKYLRKESGKIEYVGFYDNERLYLKALTDKDGKKNLKVSNEK